MSFVSRQYCRRTATLLGLMVAFALFSSFASGQTTISAGSVVGTVTDPSGAVVSGATVTIAGPTGQVIKSATNAEGRFSAANLLPGDYQVRIEAKGFKTARVLVQVRIGATTNGNARLEAGQESTVVNVPAAEQRINFQQAMVQGVLSSSQLETFPLGGRNFLDLGQLEPGVQIQDGENFDPAKAGYFSISFGSRFGRTARVAVDGVDISDETVGATTRDIPASSIQEFSLAQSNLDLSTGLTSSGAVNVTTQSGTNGYHGEAFGTFRDSALGAAFFPSPLNPTTRKPIPAPFQRNQEGGGFGGPIKRDKMFFFVDGERTQQHLTAPVAQPGLLSIYSGSFPAPFSQNELMARLDYSFSKTIRLFGRANYFDSSAVAASGPSSFQIYRSKNNTRDGAVGLDFNTGAITHSIRFAYLKFQNAIADRTQGSGLPFANYPVGINVGLLTAGPNWLAPQNTLQSNAEIRYDGSKVYGDHILRFGGSWNHIQAARVAGLYSIAPKLFGTTPFLNSSDPTTDAISYAMVGNGQGFSTPQAAFGSRAGGLGPDNRVSLYFGDLWKVGPNLTLSPGLRWVRDTGRTDSDLGPIPEINAAFPGFGNRVHQPNTNFAPQLGLAWDPTGNAKTVVRAGIGLFYENALFNNILFDRPLRLKDGTFLATRLACFGGAALPIPGFENVDQFANNTGLRSICSENIGQAASTLAAFQRAYQSANTFSLTNPNPNYIGTLLSQGANISSANGEGLFAPFYKSPRAVQMNIGIQHQIRPGAVLSVDYLRNVETHALLNVDVNHAGATGTYNQGGARSALNATEAAFGHPGDVQGTIDAGAKISDFVARGLGSPVDVGASCLPTLGYPCAFPGLNPLYGQTSFLEPISRSVYSAVQLRLVDTVANPMPGIKTATFQVAYSLSRFVNPLGFQGNSAPSSNPFAVNDQDALPQASDNDDPLKYMGPSLLDRTHQVSFSDTFSVRWGFQFAMIGHFYSPLSSPLIVGNTGTGGQIFQTDFTGSGSYSDPLPGTKNGSFMRDFNVGGLTDAISKYNATIAGQPTPAGQQLISHGLFTAQQLTEIGAVAPVVSPPPVNQLTFPWLKAFDCRVSWKHTFAERYSIEPNVGFYNLFNIANYNLPPNTMSGWLNEGSGSINSVVSGHGDSVPFRVGAGTGVFGLGSPRTIEWGLRLSF